MRPRPRLTPREVKAPAAKHAHGHILEPSSGALYVHMHREHGLAHRHYVLRPWQVRVLGVLVSRPLLVFYTAAIVTWFWMASQAARVPLLQQEISVLTEDAARLDALTAQLDELRSRYEQVQRMLSAASAGRATRPDTITRPRADSSRQARTPDGRESP